MGRGFSQLGVWSPRWERVDRQDAKSAKVAKDLGREEPNTALDALVHRVIGAAIEVHRQLGPGFLESVYEEALCVELLLRGIPFARQVSIGVQYKQRDVGEARLDLLVDDSVVVELKACQRIAPIHIAQALSYLKATRRRLALLINFDVPVLQHGIKRIIHNP
jgi:GxxExxY protein